MLALKDPEIRLKKEGERRGEEVVQLRMHLKHLNVRGISMRSAIG